MRPRKLRPPRDDVQPIDGRGAYADGPLLSLEEVHSKGILHKALWLHVLSSDHQLLLVRQPARAATCAGRLSVVRSHHVRRESDEHCARRMMREELPGLPKHIESLLPLRPKPRWFLYEDGDGVRHERALVSEWVLRLSLNASDAAQLLRQATASREAEPLFLSLDALYRSARAALHGPAQYCAPALLPAALADSVADVCRVFGARGERLSGCAATRTWRLSGSGSAALSEVFDRGSVVFDPALQCGTLRRPTSHAAKRLINRFGTQANCSAAFLAAAGLGGADAHGALPDSHMGNLLISAMVVGCAYFGFRRLFHAMQDGGHY